MPAPHHSVFYRPDALPASQPTAPKSVPISDEKSTLTDGRHFENTVKSPHLCLTDFDDDFGTLTNIGPLQWTD